MSAITNAVSPIRSARTCPVPISRWAPTVSASDTRPAARRFFNVDAESIVVATLVALARDGHIDVSVAAAAAEKYQITDVSAAPEQTSDPGSMRPHALHMTRAGSVSTDAGPTRVRADVGVC